MQYELILRLAVFLELLALFALLEVLLPRRARVQGMVVGLEWQDERPAQLGWSLWLPFRR